MPITRQSPRIRRLRNDFKALQKLRQESTIIDFDVQGNPPEYYTLRFHGRGLWRLEGGDDVLIRETHEISIKLGASYPRMMPELLWKTPIFHPNISASGVVCLGGYGTYWTPGLNLDELCCMLWDMIRYENFDVESPYNREAAHWAKTQVGYTLPVDGRSIRDRISDERAPFATDFKGQKPPITRPPTRLPESLREYESSSESFEAGDSGEVMFLDSSSESTPNPHRRSEGPNGEILNAEVIETEDSDILFIE